ncbi:unnamed protein product [Caenorhabditis brenneri]
MPKEVLTAYEIRALYHEGKGLKGSGCGARGPGSSRLPFGGPRDPVGFAYLNRGPGGLEGCEILDHMQDVLVLMLDGLEVLVLVLEILEVHLSISDVLELTTNNHVLRFLELFVLL